MAGNSEPELVYSAIFAPTDDELFDVMVIIPLDGRAIYISILIKQVIVCRFVCLSVCLFICSAMGGQTARPNGLKFGG